MSEKLSYILFGAICDNVNSVVLVPELAYGNADFILLF